MQGVSPPNRLQRPIFRFVRQREQFSSLSVLIPRKEHFFASNRKNTFDEDTTIIREDEKIMPKSTVQASTKRGVQPSTFPEHPAILLEAKVKDGVSGILGPAPFIAGGGADGAIGGV